MTRQPKTGVEAVKMRLRKAATPKRCDAPKATRHRGSSSTDLREKVALFKRERDESQEQLKATAEVLRVVSASSGDLKLIFEVILQNSTHLCEANFGVLFLCEGDALRAVAMHNAPPAYAEARGREPLVMSSTTVIGEVARAKRTIQTADIAKHPAYRKNPKYTQLFVKLAGVRSFVGVPILKDDVLIGVIGIFRQEVRLFTNKQIGLVQNFAAQAVIAIENTRLLSELRQSLEQQTATADVLKVISSSPGELDPVFLGVLANATRICEAKFGTMYFRESDGFRAVAMHGAPPAFVESRLHKLVHPGPATGIGRVLQTKQAVQIEDASTDQGYSERDPMRVSSVELGGVRTLLDVPMLKENEVIGSVAIYREVVRPFTKQANWGWCRILPIRPSSPSRTRGCSTNCVSAPMISLNPSSSRLPLPMYSKSSVARPSI